MKKWTVGFVNYKTTVYLKWQFKILYEFNDPREFDVIIVDNSRPPQKNEIDQLIEWYVKAWNNIRVIYNTPKTQKASGQHAEGLTVAV